MSYFLGVDIGSVGVKIALVDEAGAVLLLDSTKITTSPRAAVNSLVASLSEKFDGEGIEAVGVSGSGKGIVPPGFGWTEYSSSLAIASGLLQSHPDARTIIQIGGQSSLVIELERGLERPWKVASNPLCAAGTGRFLEQQAYRLGIGIEDFGKLAVNFHGVAPRIAAR
jgi:activator of 2-hydroxyglutaryl-CoA dehydratase